MKIPLYDQQQTIKATNPNVLAEGVSPDIKAAHEFANTAMKTSFEVTDAMERLQAKRDAIAEVAFKNSVRKDLMLWSLENVDKVTGADAEGLANKTRQYEAKYTEERLANVPAHLRERYKGVMGHFFNSLYDTAASQEAAQFQVAARQVRSEAEATAAVALQDGQMDTRAEADEIINIGLADMARAGATPVEILAARTHLAGLAATAFAYRGDYKTAREYVKRNKEILRAGKKYDAVSDDIDRIEKNAMNRGIEASRAAVEKTEKEFNVLYHEHKLTYKMILESNLNAADQWKWMQRLRNNKAAAPRPMQSDPSVLADAKAKILTNIQEVAADPFFLSDLTQYISYADNKVLETMVKQETKDISIVKSDGRRTGLKRIDGAFERGVLGKGDAGRKKYQEVRNAYLETLRKNPDMSANDAYDAVMGEYSVGFFENIVKNWTIPGIMVTSPGARKGAVTPKTEVKSAPKQKPLPEGAEEGEYNGIPAFMLHGKFYRKDTHEEIK